MATKLSYPEQQDVYNGRKFNYVNPRAPVSKSEGDLKFKRVKEEVPKWQNRSWSVTSQENDLDILSISTEYRELEKTMRTHYPRINTPLDYYSVYDISDEVKKVRRLSAGNSRSVTPSRGRQNIYSRGSVDFSIGGRQEMHYHETIKAYDVIREQAKRQNEFVHKYITYRSRLARERLKEQRDTERRRIEKENQILKELKKKRAEFQREKDWRVRTQYVTWKTLEHERLDRESYGLPLHVQADFFLKKRRPKKLAPIKQILINETPRYQNISDRLVKNMYGKSYPTIEPGIKPPAFGWKNRRINETKTTCKNVNNLKERYKSRLDDGKEVGKIRSPGKDQSQDNCRDRGQIVKSRNFPTAGNTNTTTAVKWSTGRNEPERTYNFRQYGGPFKKSSRPTSKVH